MDPLTKLCVKQTIKSALIWYGVSVGVVLFVWLVRVLIFMTGGSNG